MPVFVIESDGTSDLMTLRCESSEQRDGLAVAVADSVRDVCKLRGRVDLVEPDALPNDGIVIEDKRTYE